MLLLLRSLLEATAPVVVAAGGTGEPRRRPAAESSGWVAPARSPVPRRNKQALLLTALPLLRH